MSLLDDVRIVVTPNGYKAGELYAVIPVPTEGAEEVTNGDFATDSDWTKGTGWTISGGSANSDGANSFSSLSQASVLTIGKRYKLIVDINLTSGQLRIQEGGAILETYTTTGANTAIYYFIATATNITFKTSVTPFNGSIDNVSVKEYTSADMDVTRGTAATRVDENGFVNYAEVIGSEEVTNGDFATDTDWTKGTGWSISGGTANCIGGAGSLNLTQVALEIGKTYTVTYTVSNYSAGTIHPIMGGWTHGTYQSSNGTYTEVISNNHASANTTFYMQGKSGFVGSIDNVSVKEVTRDNVPRIDYTGGGCPHILAEPQRTNLVTYSEDFSQSSWASANISLGISTVLSPDGTTYSYKLTNDAASGNHFVRDNSTVTSGVPYTLSVFIKKRTRDIVSLGDGYSVNILANFDLTNGTSTNVSATSSSIESFNDGWFKCIATITPTTTTLGFMIFSGDVYAGKDESGDFYVWGAQLEEGSYATSYIPTSGSTVTRNQDIFTRDGIGSLINSQEGVLFIEMAVLSADTINRYISLSNGTDDNSISFHFRNNANNQVRVILKSGNVNQFDSTYNPSGSTDFVKVAFKYKVNDFALWVNGTEISTDTSGITFTADTLNRLAFDDGQGGSPLFGKVKQLQVYESALTDPQLEALTK